jgi:subtilisin family serine protease
MFHPTRIHKRSASFRSTPLLALFVLLALVAGLSAHAQNPGAKSQAPDLKSAKAGEAKAMSLSPAPAGFPDTLSPELRSAAASLMSTGREARVASPQGGSGSLYYYVIRAEFDSAASRQRLRVPGATLLTAYDRFAELFIPPAADGKGADQQVQNALFSSPGLVWVDMPLPVEVPPAPGLRVGAATRAVPEQIVHGGINGLTGKGVIVAVLDSGIDFRNPDFINFDASGRPTSRLLYFWDTFSTAFDASKLGGKPPYSFPNGQSIGTLYTRQQLTAELASGSKRIPATDENGHGTAATGIAAGNGNNSKGAYVGVAPEADIIGVRIGGSSGSIENGYLLNAIVAWIDSVARSEGKAVVFSCSFGGHMGGHDGLSVEERELNARFASNVPGRAIVVAAGNEQRAGLHSQEAFQGDTQPARFAWKSEKPALVSFFLHSKSGGGIPDPKQVMIAPLVVTADGQQQQIPMPKLVVNYQNPISHDLVLQFISPGGWAGYVVWSSTGAPTVIDGYILGGGSFHPSIQRVAEIVGTPGTTSAAITVGSYDWNDQFSYQGKAVTVKDYVCGGDGPIQVGNLSCYSSIGYSRAGTIKPDITSPGQWFISSYAKLPDGSGVNLDHHIVDTSGNYTLFNGTSAATPYTAGIVALMFQKRPTLTSGEVKSLLQRNATQDSVTGAVPNLAWGYGKLDLAAVRATLNAIR